MIARSSIVSDYKTARSLDESTHDVDVAQIQSGEYD